MLKKNYVFKFMLLLSILSFCMTSYSLPINCSSGSQRAKIIINRDLPNAKINRDIYVTNINGKPTPLRPVTRQRVTTSEIYEHSIEGDWDFVVGQVGFYHQFEELGDAFVSIIGIGTYDLGDGVYETEDWNREAFWMEIGDGGKKHLAAEWYGEFEGLENETEYVYIYYSYNLLYRQNGVDYSESDFNGEWIDFELITDTDNNYIDHNIYLFDDNGELRAEKKVDVGDQILACTAIFDLDDPETIWVATMDETFTTVQAEPVFTYEHLTPNVDFSNETTQGLIDFSNVDLHLVLLGVNEDNTEFFNYSNDPFKFSSVIDMGIKWNGSASTSVLDWFFHWFE